MMFLLSPVRHSWISKTLYLVLLRKKNNYTPKLLRRIFRHIN